MTLESRISLATARHFAAWNHCTSAHRNQQPKKVVSVGFDPTT